MSGRPSENNFHLIKKGEKQELKGKAKKWPHQYAPEFNRNNNASLKIVRDGRKVFILNP